MANRSGGPFSGTGPKGFKRPPDSLEGQVCDALKANGYVNASEIDVEVKSESGEVILTGTVPDADQQRLAEECVVSVSGISTVHNRLTVDHNMGDSGHDGSRDFGENTGTAKRPAQTLGKTPDKSEQKH